MTRKQPTSYGKHSIHLNFIQVVMLLFSFALLPAQDWTLVQSPTNQNFARLDMVNDSVGWAVSYDGLVIHYENGNWQIVDSLSQLGFKTYQGDIWTIRMMNTEQGWAALNDIDLNFNALLHYRQGGWDSQPIIMPIKVRDMDFLDETYGMATGGDGAYEYLNGEWTSVSLPINVDFRSVHILDREHIYLAGEKGTVLYYDGQWHVLEPPIDELIRDMDFISPDLGWFVGNEGTILQYKKGIWSLIPSGTTEHLWAVDMLSDSLGFTVGKNGVILEYNGRAWKQLERLTDADLHDIEMLSTEDGWIVGAWGNIMHYSRDAQGILDSQPKFLFYDTIHAGSGTLMDRIDDIQGVISTDFNGDGLPDIYLTGYLKLNHLLLNQGQGYYTDYSIKSGTGGSIETRSTEQKFESGSFAADFDRDGDADILIIGNIGATQLLANDGKAVFKDITAKSKLPDNLDIISGTILDCNEDGYPDLAFADKKNGLRIMINNKYNTFREMETDSLDYIKTGIRALIAGDFNNDMHTDLLLFFSNEPPLLLENDGDAEYTISKRSIIKGQVSKYISSVSMADFNRDGHSDLFICTEDGSDDLYLYQPQLGYFESVTFTWGVLQSGKSYTAIPGDFNLDGYMDVLVTRAEADLLYLNNDGDSFIETAQSAIYSKSGYLSGFNTGGASMDIDLDGDLDLVIGNRGYWSSLLKNSTNNQKWVTIRIQGNEDTYEALGAKVWIYESASDNLIHYRQMLPVNGYSSQSWNAINTGVREIDLVDIRIQFLSGEQVLLEKIHVGDEVLVYQSSPIVRLVYQAGRAVMQFLHIPMIPFELFKMVVFLLAIMVTVKSIENRYEWRHSHMVIYLFGSIAIYASLTFPFFQSGNIMYHLLPFIVLMLVMAVLVSVNEQIRRRNIKQRQIQLKLREAGSVITNNTDINKTLTIVIKTIRFLYPYKNAAIYLYYPFGNYFLCHKADRIKIAQSDMSFALDRDAVKKLMRMKVPINKKQFVSIFPKIDLLNDDTIIFPMTRKHDCYGMCLMNRNSKEELVDENILNHIRYLMMQLTNTISNIRNLEQVQDQQQLFAIGTFSSGVLHNLKNPVDGMRLMIEELMNETDLTDEKRKYIDALHVGVLKLKKDLVNSFDLNKGKRCLNEKCNVNAIIKQAISNFGKLPYPDIRIRLNNDLSMIRCDEEEIEQALKNLIENAFEASDYSKDIEISTYQNKKSIFIDIRDYGRGISVEKMKNLSKMFYSSHGDGRGLGLSITKNIIERQGGYIDFKSIEDSGTVFSIALPVTEKRR